MIGFTFNGWDRCVIGVSVYYARIRRPKGGREAVHVLLDCLWWGMEIMI